MLSALVLEDERPARSYLVELVEATRLARVHAAVPSVALALEALRDVDVDVAFVDVNLAGSGGGPMDGLAFVERARAEGKVARFVITTASREHALAAFDLGVIDYLTKPFVLSRVRESLSRVAEARPEGGRGERARDEGRVVARKGRSLVFLAPGEAWAFEAEGRLAFVHSAEGRLDVDLSLAALEAVLGPNYLRVHRNWLVAVARVKGIERDGGETSLVVGDGTRTVTVPVARDRVGQVKARLLSSTIGLRLTE
jgi:DNA-binding LytR/AlgR family response regulator